MSADSPIQLLDDDDDSPAEKEEEAIRLFLEVTNSNSRTQAIKLLTKAQFNVQQALALSFADNAKRDMEPVVVEPRVVTTICSPDRKLSATTSHSVPPASQEAVDAEIEPPLGITIHWLDCMAKVSDRFVDPDFPPNRSSLDGRSCTSNGVEVVKCVCGIPAASKTVQSDGPNYGRFYFACGVKGRSSAKCKFFQWDTNAGGGYATRYTIMHWEFFGQQQHVLYRNNFSPDAVRQGAVGNCWFLSALAVVAEHSYLVKALLPHVKLNEKGVYQVNFCLDGKWTPILVDSHLPVVMGGPIVDPLRGGTTTTTATTTTLGTVHPAFCATPLGQLWPALIEKAYAKAHGSYEQLSGGFIQEGFGDMTGAPCETLIFDGNIWDFDELWARLLSFHDAGFLMGVATNKGGDGLVGGHAYSILNIIEVNDVIVGEQQSMTAFLASAPPPKKKKRTTVRLVRIRNPWGKKEWKGEWSANSEQWTRALRKKLGKEESYAKGDGTFFISYQDMLQRFHHMDVAKCRKGWKNVCCDGMFLGGDALDSTMNHYRLSVEENTYCFVSIIQPKKRANTKSQYYYADPSMLIARKRKNGAEWECEQVMLSGTSRSSVCEVFLDPSYDYLVVPFSSKNCKGPFRITSYSAKVVNIARCPKNEIGGDICLGFIHRHLLKDERKLHYVVAPQSILVCSHGYRCLYFTAVNASSDRLLSLRMTIKLQKGLILSHGVSGETFDVGPKSQSILMCVSGDGTMSSAVSMDFTYASDIIRVNAPKSAKRNSTIGSSIELSMAGELLAQGVDPGCSRCKGGDTVETCHWIAQIGSSPH